jgi:hypothetical protein
LTARLPSREGVAQTPRFSVRLPKPGWSRWACSPFAFDGDEQALTVSVERRELLPALDAIASELGGSAPLA